jgi:hypothetical protein
MLEDTVKRHEENVLATSLMTMSQMPVPDVARELAEASALHALFAAVQRDEERSQWHVRSPLAAVTR